MKILLIEDDDILADLVADILRCACVTVASSVESAKKILARDGAPDIALVDLSLPDSLPTMTIEFLRELKQDHPETHVCVMTAFGEKRLCNWCLDAGADLFLEKNKTSAFFSAINDIARFAAAAGPCYDEQAVRKCELTALGIIGRTSLGY